MSYVDHQQVGASMINQVRLLTCRLRIWIRIQRSWHINHLQKPDEADLSYRPYYLVERHMYLTEKGCHLTETRSRVDVSAPKCAESRGGMVYTPDQG